MNTPKEQRAANSSLTTCHLSLEDRAAEYSEALNDIADMLQLPTGATSADIVAACYRELNMETEQNQLATSTQPMNTPKTDQLWSWLEQLGWKRDRLPVSKIMASHEALELELAAKADSPRYKVIPESQSGHCCFDFTVVDTTRPVIIGGEQFEGQFEAVCECFDEDAANLVCNSLNSASKNDQVEARQQ